MTQQAVRVDDDDRDDSMGMGAAGIVSMLLITVGLALLIATLLWLPEIYRRWGGWHAG